MRGNYEWKVAKKRVMPLGQARFEAFCKLVMATLEAEGFEYFEDPMTRMVTVMFKNANMDKVTPKLVQLALAGSVRVEY